MSDFISLMQRNRSLTEEETATVMSAIMEGRASHEQMAGFLTALARRGETADEIVGAARVLRAKAASIVAPDNAVDCCGTGGDGLGTYNISTAVALVAAACGVPVAKHGNRAASSRAGAADVLEALGVSLDISPAQAEIALRQYNFAFLMAPRHHQAMKHVAPVRKELGFRTIFNLLGPLVNPAGARRQLVGVYDRKWLMSLAESLHRLGTEKAWIVHGADGLDEITVTGPTHIVRLEAGNIREETLTPKDFGLAAHHIDELRGGDPETNAEALRSLLEGLDSAYRGIVLANAAAILVIADVVSGIKDGVGRAAEAIDSGAALKVLENYRAFTRQKEAA